MTFALQDSGIRPCDVDPNNGDDRELGIGFVSMSVADFEAPEVELDTSYDFSTDGWAYFDSGWYGTEDWGRWMSGEGSLGLAFDRDPGELQLSVTMHSYYKNQLVDIIVNGTEVDSIEVEPSNRTYNIFIPDELIESGTSWIVFDIEGDTVAPATLDSGNSDSRQLGVGLESIELKEAA